MKLIQFLAVISLLAASANSVKRNAQLVRVYKVTPAEYEALKRSKLWSEGRSVPIDGLRRWAADIRSGISNTFFNYFGTEEIIADEGDKEYYPVCVVADFEHTQLRRSRAYTWHIVRQNQRTSVRHNKVRGRDDGASDNEPVANCLLVIKDDEVTTEKIPENYDDQYADEYQDSEDHEYRKHSADEEQLSDDYADADYYRPSMMPLPIYYPYQLRDYVDNEQFGRFISAQFQQALQHQHNSRKRARAADTNLAYQAATYPKIEYASNYPKVTRNHGSPFPAPIYVRPPIQTQNTSAQNQLTH